MKQSDIGTLIVVASASVIVAYFTANAVIGSPTAEPQTVRTTTEITQNIVEPDSTIFNKDAINPTVEVVIGEKESP